VAALDANYKVIAPSNPAVRGQSIALYANGLGPVTDTPASGDPASATLLSLTTSTPTVTIGGIPAPVSFSGLAPGFAGLYQINVTVPSTISAGTQPIIVSIGGQSSKASGITVQ
jgi:minor extracellular serine protease Vpr